jgi:DNA-binding PucR family transcriptional regulator
LKAEIPGAPGKQNRVTAAGSVGKVVSTARRLLVHESTVKYRIRKCQELLGRPPSERSQKLEAAILLADSLKRST